MPRRIQFRLATLFAITTAVAVSVFFFGRTIGGSVAIDLAFTIICMVALVWIWAASKPRKRQ